MGLHLVSANLISYIFQVGLLNLKTNVVRAGIEGAGLVNSCKYLSPIFQTHFLSPSSAGWRGGGGGGGEAKQILLKIPKISEL